MLWGQESLDQDGWDLVTLLTGLVLSILSKILCRLSIYMNVSNELVVRMKSIDTTLNQIITLFPFTI